MSFELADANFTGKPAAVIMEPVLSAGGIIVPPPGILKALRRYTHERGMLLILDESQTGLGKTGKMWGHLHEDVVPDKHFGAGLPIAAVTASAALAGSGAMPERGSPAAGAGRPRPHECHPPRAADGVN